MIFRQRDLDSYTDVPRHEYSSFSGFTSSPVKSGISRISSGGMHLDFMYEDTGAPVTFVYFHAALGLKQTYPFFGGRSMLGGIAANYLGIADPVAGLANAPTAGWHLGTHTMPLHDVLVDVLEHVLDTASGTSLLFFGASAGGFAALFYGARFKSSLSIVVNPRTALLNPPHTFDEYQDIAYPDSSVESIGELICMDTAVLHNSGRGNTVGYIQNLQDKRFLNNQLVPFLDQCPGEEKVFLKLGEYGVGHVVPPRHVLRGSIKRAINSAPNWKNGLLSSEFIQAPTSNGLVKACRASIRAAKTPV